MGMYNDNREYEPNQSQSNNRTMSVFNAKIKFRDDAEGQYGPQLKLKCAPVAGGEDVVCYLSATHKDQGALVPGAVVVLLNEDGKKFPKYISLAPADASQPTASPQAPGQPVKEPVTLDQVTQTWVKIYQHLADTLPDQDEKSRRKSATTVFIAACQHGALWKE